MGGCFSKDADKDGGPNGIKAAGGIGDGGFRITNENLREAWESFTKKPGFSHHFKDKGTVVYSKICPGLLAQDKPENPYKYDLLLAEREGDHEDPEIAKVTKALLNLNTDGVSAGADDKPAAKPAAAANGKPQDGPSEKRTIYKCRKDDIPAEGGKSARANAAVISPATATVAQTELDWTQLWSSIFGKDGAAPASRADSFGGVATLADSGSSRGVRGHVGIHLILNKIVKYIQYWTNLKNGLLLDMVSQDDTPLQVDPKTQQLVLNDDLKKQIQKELDCEELDVAIEDRMKELGVTFASVVQDLCTQPVKSIKNPEFMKDWFFHPSGYQAYFKPAEELEAYFRCINMSLGLQKQVENELMAMIEEGPNKAYNENYLKVCVSFNQLYAIIIKKETQIKVDDKPAQDLMYLAVTGPVGTKDKVEQRRQDFEKLDPAKKAKARFDNIFIESQILKIRDGILDIVRNIANPMRRSLQTCLILTKVKTACIRAILATLDDVKTVEKMIASDLESAQKEFKAAKDPNSKELAKTNLRSTFYYHICGLLKSEITQLCQMVYRDFERKQDSLDKLSSCLSLLRSHCLEIIGYYKAIDLVRVSEIREIVNAIQKETRIFRIETKNLLVDLIDDIQSYTRYLAEKLGEGQYDPTKDRDKSNTFKDANNAEILEPVLLMKEEYLYLLMQSIDVTDFGKSESTQAVENFRLSYAFNAINLVRHDLHYLKLNMMGLFEDRFSDGTIHDIWKCRYKDPLAVKDAMRYIDDKKKQFGKAAEESTAAKSRRVQTNDARDLKPQPDMPPYVHEPALSVAAMRHSKFMAKAGSLSHKVEGQLSIQSMLEQYSLQLKGDIGVSVGQFKHLEIYRIVLELILEDGLSVKNNREHVLSSKFKKVGFGFAKSEGENSESQFFVTFIFAEEDVATKVAAIPENDPDEPVPQKDQNGLLYKDIFFNDALVEVNKFGVVKKYNQAKTEGGKATAGTNSANTSSPQGAGQPNSTAGANQSSVPGQGAGVPANQAKGGANPNPAQANNDPTKVIQVPK